MKYTYEVGEVKATYEADTAEEIKDLVNAIEKNKTPIVINQTINNNNKVIKS